jgi:hypothetical protein
MIDQQKFDAIFDTYLEEQRKVAAKHRARVQEWRDFHANKHWVPNLRVHDLGSAVADLAIKMERNLNMYTNGE